MRKRKLDAAAELIRRAPGQFRLIVNSGLRQDRIDEIANRAPYRLGRHIAGEDNRAAVLLNAPGEGRCQWDQCRVVADAGDTPDPSGNITRALLGFHLRRRAGENHLAPVHGNRHPVDARPQSCGPKRAARDPARSTGIEREWRRRSGRWRRQRRHEPAQDSAAHREFWFFSWPVWSGLLLTLHESPQISLANWPKSKDLQVVLASTA